MLCTNGHNNPDNARFCTFCGVNTFQPGTVGMAPAPGALAPANATTNGFAIAALVCGVVWVLGLGSIMALIFGLVARRQIRERGQQGTGLAIAGIVLGVAGICLTILWIVLVVDFGHALNSCHFNDLNQYICN
jgi:hypothetical protein